MFIYVKINNLDLMMITKDVNSNFDTDQILKSFAPKVTIKHFLLAKKDGLIS